MTYAVGDRLRDDAWRPGRTATVVALDPVPALRASAVARVLVAYDAPSAGDARAGLRYYLLASATTALPTNRAPAAPGALW